MCGKGKKTGVLVYGGGFRVIVYCFQIVSRVGGGWFSDPCCDSVGVSTGGLVPTYVMRLPEFLENFLLFQIQLI